MNGQTSGAPQADNSGITHEAHAAAVSAARAEGERAGAEAERTRIMGILNHAEAAGRPKLAMTLAGTPGMTAEASALILAAAAKETGGTTLADASAGLAEFGADAAGAGKPDAGAEVDAAWKAAMTKSGLKV